MNSNSEKFLKKETLLSRVVLGWAEILRIRLVLPLFHPCGNFSDTSSLKLLKTKGSIGHAFTVCIHTENQNQVSFYPFVLHEISVLIELTLGHLCYHLTDVPPQPNSQPDGVLDSDRPARRPALSPESEPCGLPPLHSISKKTIRVVVFHRRIAAPTYSTPLMSFHLATLRES